MEFYELIGFQNATGEPDEGATDLPDLARAAILTDFDGTLVDLAETPDGIVIDPRIEQTLNALLEATGGAVAVVSGRRMSDLREFLPGFRGRLIGSHGAEWAEGDAPDGDVRRHPAVDSPAFSRLVDIVKSYASHDPAILIEDKPCSIVLHFRQAPDRLPDADRFLTVLLDQTEGFVLHHAKMALEVMPDDVSKQAACTEVLGDWPDRTPVALGDDTTDEGMLSLAVERGGLGVKVGDGQTVGNRRLGGPADVLALFERWLNGGAA